MMYGFGLIINVTTINVMTFLHALYIIDTGIHILCRSTIMIIQCHVPHKASLGL